MKFYQSLVVAVALSLLVVGGSVSAAYNDVTLTTDTVIVPNGTVNVSGSSGVIESITVNELNFSIVLPQNSTVTLSEASGKALLSSNTDVVSSNTCSGGSSTMVLSNTGADSVTTLISDLGTSCPSSSSSGSSGGGGGGGGGYWVPSALPSLPATSTVPAHTSVTQIVQAPVVQSVSPMQSGSRVTKALRKGMTSPEVKLLQKVLNSDVATQITKSGAGSPGNETELFGSLTLAALKKFQVKYSIVSPGQEGYGNLGPKTRAKVNEILGSMSGGSSMTAPQSQDNSKTASDISQQIQDALAKIKELQLQLQTAH